IAGKYFEDAMSLRYLIRVIPIETVTETDVGRIAEAAWKLAYRIGIQESFRITVEKRRAIIHSIDIIKAVAQKVDRRVDLENPDWIILIEVIGSTTGVSVLRPNQLFHALKPQAKPIREVRL
ncbi:MAG: THUMP domain-containing protein, partial [Nitrososphaerota archaeon]